MGDHDKREEFEALKEQERVNLPEEALEDLEPSASDEQLAKGGAWKYTNITLKRGTT